MVEIARHAGQKCTLNKSLYCPKNWEQPIEHAETTGRIPFPSQRERLEGGHAVMAIGYDDKMEITNKFGGVKTKGALLIRNSWGTSWGERGYGWLPYDYVLRGLAEDFWSILKKEWVDTGAFAE